MSEVQPTDKQEINIYPLIEILWTGKKIILGLVSVSLLCLFGYQATQPTAFFNAATEIKYINSIEAEKYSKSNSFGFFTVTPRQMGDLYIEKLEERTLFEDAIRNFNLLDINKYENDEEYNKAVIALASNIKLIPPGNEDSKDPHWKINFKYNDKEKWIKSLSFIHTAATQSVKTILQQRFENYLSILRQTKNFDLEDINIEIDNLKRDFNREMEKFALEQGFKLEDIQTQIDNAGLDYDRSTADRLKFLLEQAAIARKLGVEKNTIDINTFNTTQGAILNVKTDAPYYLHGYEAIEKEVELIRLRQDKRAFIGGLLDLERTKRDLEQDKTIKRAEKNKVFLDSLYVLEKQIREIEQDKTIERAEYLFASIPISNADDFKAISVTIESTDFEIQSMSMLLLALTLMISFSIGSMYVVISSGIQNHRQHNR